MIGCTARRNQCGRLGVAPPSPTLYGDHHKPNLCQARSTLLRPVPSVGTRWLGCLSSLTSAQGANPQHLPHGVPQKHHGDTPADVMPLPAIVHDCVVPSPLAVVRARLNRGSWELLVQWVLGEFTTHYPDFQLEDELFCKKGGSVVDIFVGKTYAWRNK